MRGARPFALLVLATVAGTVQAAEPVSYTHLDSAVNYPIRQRPTYCAGRRVAPTRTLPMRHTPLFAAAVLGLSMMADAPDARAAGAPAIVTIYTTAQDSAQRLARTGTATLKPGHKLTEVENSIFVDPTKQHQALLGIGGAITDSTAEVYATLSPEKRAEFMRAYYDKQDGIGYSIARTTIHSSDSSSASYTYIEEGDKALATFSIDHDRTARIPMIKQAIAAAGGALPLYASPWSAPAFMKTNRHMLKGGALLPEYRDAWANYFVKFIQAYEKEGIPIWGITIQNLSLIHI